MRNTATCLDWTPTHNDLELANLVRRALASVQDGGRFGDRKVFIASLWIAMLCIDAEAGGRLTEGATLQHFKAWLLRSRLLTRDRTMEGERLVVLCRADLVAAMDPALVAASEIVTDGATFHFVIDPAVGGDEYAPRSRAPKVLASRTAIGRVGRVGASGRAV
jgi:hypothetical protein